VKLVFVPVVQVPPLLVLYSQVALPSMPMMSSMLLLVTPSVADAPESVCSASPGAAGGVVSTVMAALFWLGMVPRLPARSVCLTLI